MSPTEFLTEWSEQDRGLALALREVDDSTGQFGYPAELEMDADQDGYFKVKVETNFAQRALELFQQLHKPQPGEEYRVIYDRKTDGD